MDRLAPPIRARCQTGTGTRSHSVGRPLGVNPTRIGRRFCVRDSESESDPDEVDHLATCMSKLAINSSLEHNTSCGSMSLMETKSSAVAAELATPEMKQAEYSPLTSGSRPMVSMAERSNSKTQMRPWNGPLPPPRISPQRSINDVIAKIMLGQSFTCSCRPSACRSTPAIIGIRGQGACTIRNWWIREGSPGFK
jgi:hypothetical protein